MNQTIRLYKANDRQACLQIFRSNTPTYFAEDELCDFENWLNGQDHGTLAYKTTQTEKFYIMLIDDAIVACGGFYIPRNENRGNMVWGMVDSVYHKKGFGKILLEFRIHSIKSDNPDVCISLDTTQHSFSFFEKQGFNLTKITHNYYGKGLDRYDMIRN